MCLPASYNRITNSHEWSFHWKPILVKRKKKDFDMKIYNIFTTIIFLVVIPVIDVTISPPSSFHKRKKSKFPSLNSVLAQWYSHRATACLRP